MFTEILKMIGGRCSPWRTPGTVQCLSVLPVFIAERKTDYVIVKQILVHVLFSCCCCSTLEYKRIVSLMRIIGGVKS